MTADHIRNPHLSAPAMNTLPPIHVLERYLHVIAQACEAYPGNDCVFDRMEAILNEARAEARAAELDDPVERMRARRAARLGQVSPLKGGAA